MQIDLRDRVAVVTGGCSGIGLATALSLAQSGARVVVADRQLLATARQRLEPLNVVLVECDVRDEAAVARCVALAAGERGGVRHAAGGAAQAGQRPAGIDIAVHCAGIVMTGQIPEMSEESWDSCLDINLKGAFLLAKHVIPAMRARGGGAIVNMASNAGLLPRAHDPVYSTSKGALVALTRSLALSHAPERIRVNAVCPGPVSGTRIIDAELAAAADPEDLAAKIIRASPLCAALGRMVTCEEVAAAVLYLVSDAAEMVTGTALTIDGGKSLGVPPVR